MIGVLLAKFKLFVRKPSTFLLMIALSIGFTLILSTANSSTVSVPVYAADQEIRESIGEQLKDTATFTFQWVTKEELTEKIVNGKSEMGIELYEDHFQIIVGVSSANVALLEEIAHDTYEEKRQQEKIIQVADGKINQDELQEVLEKPVFTMELSSFRGKDTFIYDDKLQKLFGFTLFFVIYTIAYNVFYILVEKRDGIWDRVILSPVQKWQVYVGNLVYSFIIGYIQVVIIFLLFRFLGGTDFKGKLIEALIVIIPYVFTIVALAILITALVKSIPQFNAVLPFVAVSMAMIGGAFWPIELVESEFMLGLAKIMPITYGMDILKGLIVYGYPLKELMYPISVLVLIGTIIMGIGIHLMEKRYI